MTIRSAQQQLMLQLKNLYDEREAANITDWVMEHITGKKKVDRLLIKDTTMPADWQEELIRITKELLTHRPVQYVLGESWFAGMRFFVNESVLIPRPETEELVEWVVESQHSSLSGKDNGKQLLDVGTGSGCIPVTLKKRLSSLKITAIDISEAALQVAEKNAAAHQTDIAFIQFDFLAENSWHRLPVFDIIVSNPPYIRQTEQDTMSRNVLEFEPSIALFVPDEDALVFYRKIALFAKTHLSDEGMIFLEINELLGQEVRQLFGEHGYATEIRKDLQGRDRMVRAVMKM